ncbi:MAGE protein [Pochonia chlamydosporia 170]|uniref:MAGE protein n=1 Tax=Pochonia chlamydosporia 170 TaxID=1380566 RepID=A0A179FU61_METCM|nr:MAGE protein [Pochonia chlamydosporia 170]OAQ68623.1 MAGE protein [Pochonia chlamydosporia 170]
MPPQRRRRPVDDEDVEENPRPRQRANRDDSEQDGEYDSENGMDVDDQAGNSADDQLAKKLVRYAISCEYSRTPIRRDGIKERVLGNQGRSFKRIFALAQKQLKHVWGMELPMKSNSQPKIGSGAYILTSTLPNAYRSASIIKPSRIPSADDEATYVAFYTLVVSLIWLNGGELSEQKLKRYLLRLNADQNVSSEKTEVTMKKMERHGYVAKKVDRPPLGQDGEQTITWHVGPRAKEEIGLDGVMGLVRELYGESSDELEAKLSASLGIKEKRTTREEGNEAEASDSRGRNENGD